LCFCEKSPAMKNKNASNLREDEHISMQLLSSIYLFIHIFYHSYFKFLPTPKYASFIGT
jgi:hypothetical protein